MTYITSTLRYVHLTATLATIHPAESYTCLQKLSFYKSAQALYLSSLLYKSSRNILTSHTSAQR